MEERGEVNKYEKLIRRAGAGEKPAQVGYPIRTAGSRLCLRDHGVEKVMVRHGRTSDVKSMSHHRQMSSKTLLRVFLTPTAALLSDLP